MNNINMTDLNEMLRDLQDETETTIDFDFESVSTKDFEILPGVIEVLTEGILTLYINGLRLQVNTELLTTYNLGYENTPALKVVAETDREAFEKELAIIKDSADINSEWYDLSAGDKAVIKTWAQGFATAE